MNNIYKKKEDPNDFSRIFLVPEEEAPGDITNDSLAMALDTVRSGANGDAKYLNRAFQKAQLLNGMVRHHYHADLSRTVHITDSTPRSAAPQQNQD